MQTPNERDKEVYNQLMDVKSRCPDIVRAYREEIQRECAERAVKWAYEYGHIVKEEDIDDREAKELYDEILREN
jgi:hypothetical protein